MCCKTSFASLSSSSTITERYTHRERESITSNNIKRKAKIERLSDKVMHEQCRKFSKLLRRIVEKDQFPLRKIAIVKA